MNKDIFKKACELYKSGDPGKPENRFYDESLRLLNEIIEKETSLDDAFNLRWHIYFLRKEYQRALSDLNNAVRLNPRNRSAFYHRGMLHHHMGNLEKALKDFCISSNLAGEQGDDDLIDAVEHHVYEINKKLGRI